MASAKVLNELSQMAAQGSSLQSYQSLLQTIQADSTNLAANLNAVIASVFSQNLSVVSTRDVINACLSTLKSDTSDPDVRLAVAREALEHLTQHASSYPDQMSALLDLCAVCHEANEDFHAAAESLALIPLDTTQRKVDNADRARIWIRIVRDYLEEDESENAEPYLNKLKNVMHTVSDPTLSLHFNLSQARINDAKREFYAAASRYHDISFSTAIAEEERLHTLAMAVKCAVLAPAGPSRSRMLGRLYKDERACQLDEFGILEKMFLDRLLNKDEVDAFAQGLQRHQLATTADGSTVLAKAVVDHNLLAASRLYSNIGFDELGVLLGLSGDKAEEATAKMIEQGRLLGRMDQIDQRIWFESGDASGQGGSGRTEVAFGKETRRWAANAQGASEEVENITNALQKQFPDFVEVNLVM
ncbi:COP9 signalosome complex subunit 4 [Zalerion maritima]|uniref:COP9 signalosome complex subunit 4 n=1 Tax=Zalerion maritima TaxID=339359 RepID=A0AAD5WNB3_9PEZI|nr:COP9 signalosome complex subunit 4 [Zalerion maritima]